MNVEPPETLVIIESIVYKSNGFAIVALPDRLWMSAEEYLAWEPTQEERYEY